MKKAEVKTAEVREEFLKFFESKKHTRVASSSLLPQNDPTLLFSNAGMNQFKDLFLGNETRDYVRATTAQKCLRISGKHNDLENVGVTARHHTFFEMMGNFSFGDYFKKEAIDFAYEFVKDVIKLDLDRLWITIFDDDDEAGELWKKAGVPADRILKCGAEDNFWSMGDTGPCGPCSELHYYVGDSPKNQSEAEFRKDDGTYLEFWNLVFMQFNRSADGKMNPLPSPSVDTGMGLERMVSILNNFTSNYDTDTLRGVISICEDLTGNKYDGSDFTVRNLKEDKAYAKDVAMRVIADHSRSISFLIADGVVPSGAGRGYVLRRLIRRAVRHARVLDFKDEFLAETCSGVIKLLSAAYPQLKEQSELIIRIVSAEESKFNETIDAGLTLLSKEIKDMSAGDVLPGATAFLLHDTYGFPLDLTEDVLKAEQLTVNQEEFDTAMTAQKTRSRDDRKNQKIEFVSHDLANAPTEFLGYSQTTAEATLLKFFPAEDGSYALQFDSTPFYAESGGQVGDSGIVKLKNCKLKVIDTQKAQGKFFIHQAEIIEGELSDSDLNKAATLTVDSDSRLEIRRHHSATHLLHSALRKFLGDHVKQAGSRVDSNSLRFDYSHFDSVTDEQLAKISAWVNQEIRNNYHANTEIMDVEAAKKRGATALFGEKYGDEVRVVELGPNSMELCGGIHVDATGEIGLLVINSETSIATGTRRIECSVSKGVEAQINNLLSQQKKLAQLLKSNPKDITTKIEKLITQQKSLEKELETARAQAASSNAGDLLSDPYTSAAGIKVITSIVDQTDNSTLKGMVDELRVKLGSGVVVLASPQADKSSIIIAGATKDLKGQVHAGKILGEAVKDFGGRGGGRPDFAQAGGVSADQASEMLDKFKSLID